MKVHNSRFDKHHPIMEVIGAIVLLGLVAWVFWILYQSVPYREIPIWML